MRLGTQHNHRRSDSPRPRRRAVFSAHAYLAIGVLALCVAMWYLATHTFVCHRDDAPAQAGTCVSGVPVTPKPVDAAVLPSTSESPHCPGCHTSQQGALETTLLLLLLPLAALLWRQGVTLPAQPVFAPASPPPRCVCSYAH